MIKHYTYESLGHHDIGWLNAHFHFSFAEYDNPERMGFGALRVINDDIIKAGAGFDTHPHRNMEIITYVRQGAITHRDSQGNEGRTEAGNVQVMSAGTGIYHSEFNLESEDTNLYQIWIYPRKQGVKPAWSSREFPRSPVDTSLPLLVSGRVVDQGKDALYINQDAAIYGGRIDEGHEVQQKIQEQAYILISDGQVELDGKVMKKGDGAEITNVDLITLKAISTSEVIIIDVPQLN